MRRGKRGMCVGGIASRKRALNLKQQQLWPCANHATFVINREKHCNSADLTDLHIHLQHLQGTSGCDQEYYVLHALDIPVFIHKAKVICSDCCSSPPKKQQQPMGINLRA
ncbi:uncharacterized [Tachysurus ichikawai]